MSRWFRRVFRRRPKYIRERMKLRAAIGSGALHMDDRLRDSLDRVETCLGWRSWFEGGDWIELEMEAKERHISLTRIRDLLRLLDAVDGEGKREE